MRGPGGAGFLQSGVKGFGRGDVWAPGGHAGQQSVAPGSGIRGGVVFLELDLAGGERHANILPGLSAAGLTKTAGEVEGEEVGRVLVRWMSG